MDKKEARKILGVTRETSRNDIERKYAILLKKHRAASLPVEAPDEDTIEEGAPGSGVSQPEAAVRKNAPAAEEYTFDQVTEAYNVLMGYEIKIKEEPPSRMAPLLKKAGIDEKKARNFLYYYKYYILGALLLAVALFFGIRDFTNRVEPDFNIAFLGSFSYYDAVDKLDKSIKENIPSIKEPGIDGAYLTAADLPENQQPSGSQAYSDGQAANGGTQQPSETQQPATNQQQPAMEMKAMILITAGDVDVFIVDRDRYFQYAKQGVFLSLDDIAPKLGADLDHNKELITKAENTDASGADANAPVQEHLYGIDVSDSKVLTEAGVLGPERIAAIFAGSDRIDKAEEFIKFLMK